MENGGNIVALGIEPGIMDKEKIRFSDGNVRAKHTKTFTSVNDLDKLDWSSSCNISRIFHFLFPEEEQVLDFTDIFSFGSLFAGHRNFLDKLLQWFADPDLRDGLDGNSQLHGEVPSILHFNLFLILPADFSLDRGIRQNEQVKLFKKDLQNRLAFSEGGLPLLFCNRLHPLHRRSRSDTDGSPARISNHLDENRNTDALCKLFLCCISFLILAADYIFCLPDIFMGIQEGRVN